MAYATKSNQLCKCGCGQFTYIVRKTSKVKGVIKGEPYTYLHNHHGRKTGPEYTEDPNTGCWIWQRQINKFGYGHMSIRGRPMRAHRVYYERHKGNIPKTLEIDHVCHNADKTCHGGNTCPHRRCVNPAHLETVTHPENIRRGRTGKLTSEQVTEVQRLRVVKRLSTKTIAIQFNITPQYVSKLTASSVTRFRINTLS